MIYGVFEPIFQIPSTFQATTFQVLLTFIVTMGHKVCEPFIPLWPGVVVHQSFPFHLVHHNRHGLACLFNFPQRFPYEREREREREKLKTMRQDTFILI